MKNRSFVIGLFALATPAVFGIEVLSYSATEHDRFANSASFVGFNFDWSGVGRSDGNHWVTMISDEYFISASHFKPTSGTVRFYHSNDAAGGFEDHLVDATYGLQIGPAGSDIWVGRLSTSTSSDVASYDIFGGSADLQDIYTVGIADEGGGFTNFRVGTNQIDAGAGVVAASGVPNETFSFTYDPLIPFQASSESVVETFDSGAPSFVDVGGTLQLIGIHTALQDLGAAGPSNGDRSFDSYVGAYGSEIGAEAVPEPGSVLFLGAGSIFLLFARRRRSVD